MTKIARVTKKTKPTPKVEKKPAARKNKQPVKKTEAKPNKRTEKKNVAEKSPKTGAKVKLVNTKWIADLLSITPRRVQQLTQERVIEKHPGTDEYEFVRTMIGLVQFAWKKMDSRRTYDSEIMAGEKLRQMAAKRELEEMKVKRARGELHHTEDIKRIYGAMFSRTHTGFESYCLGTAPKAVGKTDVMEIAGILKKSLDKILFEITEYDVETLKADIGADYIDGLVDKETESDE